MKCVLLGLVTAVNLSYVTTGSVEIGARPGDRAQYFGSRKAPITGTGRFTFSLSRRTLLQRLIRTARCGKLYR